MSPVPDLPDADAIAAAIATCPSVSGLSGGIAGEVATYLPGRRVSGIRSNPGSVEVHVVTKYGSPLHTVDAEVRAAVQAAVPGPLEVNVVLADVEDPFAPEPEPEEPRALEAGPSAPPPAALPGSGEPVVSTVTRRTGSPTGTPTTAAPSGTAGASAPTSPQSGTAQPGSPTSGPPAAHVPPPPIAP